MSAATSTEVPSFAVRAQGMRRSELQSAYVDAMTRLESLAEDVAAVAQINRVFAWIERLETRGGAINLVVAEQARRAIEGLEKS